MFIQTEATPNPATLKFLPGREVMGAGTANFPSAETASRSPLAERLFQIEGVTGVFLGSDFVTVTKQAGRDWQVLKPAILGAIMEHFTAGKPILLDSPAAAEAAPDGAENEIVAQIKELLDTRVRPAVAQDGGDIIFHGFEDGIVYLHMQGSCSGCPSSTATLKAGIENMLRHYLPEVVEVRAGCAALQAARSASPLSCARIIPRVVSPRVVPPPRVARPKLARASAAAARCPRSADSAAPRRAGNATTRSCRSPIPRHSSGRGEDADCAAPPARPPGCRDGKAA